MRRLLSGLLAIMIVWGIIPVCTNAAEYPMDIIHLDDGSYMTVEIITDGARASGSVTGNKRYTYYGSDGGSEWVAVLTGSFTYTGTSATCTSSKVNVTIYDSTWYVISKSASKSGNTATASVTMGKTSAGVTVMRVPVDLTLKCDVNGNLS